MTNCRFSLVVTIFLFSLLELNSQTILSPGDFSFTCFNADGDDDFGIVLLTDIDGTTTPFTSYFTDNEWNGSTLNSGEGEVEWTVTTLIPAGTVVTFSDVDNSSSIVVSHGSVSGSMSLAGSNEVIYAFTGSTTNPMTFISAIANDGFSTVHGTLMNTGLTEGTHAINLGVIDADADIGEYVGPRVGFTPYAAYLSEVINTSNWIAQDGTGDQSIDGTLPDVPCNTTAFDDSPDKVFGPGDISFVCFNADGDDDFGIVLLKPIEGATSPFTMYFNDNEWDGTSFNIGEGEIKWTVNTNLPAGTIITFNQTSNSMTLAVSHGSATGRIPIAAENEVIYAFIGSPASPITFISAIANDGFNLTNGTLTSTGLVDGSQAINLGAIDRDADIGEYVGPRIGLASYSAYLSEINNTSSNWMVQNGTRDQSMDDVIPDLPCNTESFELSLCPDMTEVSIDITVKDNLCVGEGGSITYGTCPEGSYIEFSNDGMTWSNEQVIYDPRNSIDVYARCNCDGEVGQSTMMTTDPITAISSTAVLTIVDNVCEGDLGSITGVCAMGSIEFSVDGSNWTSTAPVYNEKISLDVYARCRCDNDVVSSTIKRTTDPVTDFDCIKPSISDPCHCDDPLNIALGGGLFLFHDILKVTTVSGRTVRITATDGNLLDNTQYAIPVNTNLIETPAGSGIYLLDFYTNQSTPSTITITDGTFTRDFTTAACTSCIAVPTMGEWGLISLGLLLLILGVVTIKQKVLAVP